MAQKFNCFLLMIVSAAGYYNGCSNTFRSPGEHTRLQRQPVDTVNTHRGLGDARATSLPKRASPLNQR